MPCVAESQPVPILVEDFVRVLIEPDTAPTVCRTGAVTLRHDERVVVEVGDQQYLARVSRFVPPVLKAPRGRSARVIRIATDEDRAQGEQNLLLGEEICAFVRRRAQDLDLGLKPAKVRVPLVGKKVIVEFTAEQKVDFRALLRETSRRYNRRIEMRALGVRDGARQVGGIGPCGRGLCCSGFMNRFHSVTVRMAKRQNLSLNPTKISGMCGRLMCCLAHEVDQYPELVRRPKKSANQR
jgi:cell fate regulator YaaT (PSP1 superfamily)